MKKTRSIFLWGLMSFMLVMAACETNPEPPKNPFDDIDYTGNKIEKPKPDSASIIGLHQYIFSQSCAVPACHDGSFEPDYRTVLSTYSTLVYQPVVKNDPSGSFTYRVIPNDVEGSWLYNRLTTDDQTLGRMPLYDNPLTEAQLASVREWINAGAPDMFGKAAHLPNTQPRITAIAAYNRTGTLEVRRDTARVDGNPIYPFIAAKNFDLDVWLSLEDDSTALEDLQQTRLGFSEDSDDYSNAVFLNATYSPNPKIIEDFYGAGRPGVFYWKVTIDAGTDLPIDPNGITFYRLYTQDGNHSEEYIFPRQTHPIEFKLYLSFVRV